MFSPHPLAFSLYLASTVWTAWYLIGGPHAAFDSLVAHWEVALTMAFGSLIAGATSVGGGAVAFPVFTKLLEISPQDAKVFSLAIQSVGMTAASLTILALRIPVEWRVIGWASLGGIPGIVLGSALLAPVLPSAMIKMSFTVMVTSFAVTLFALNRGMRLCHARLPRVGASERLLLLSAGLVGGVMSGLVGNGIDIVTFSLIVLLFRVDEKVATPTSVVLMAISAVLGFGLHYFILDDFTPLVQAYWLAAVPVVVVGAPAGAMLCRLLSRTLIARILIGLIMVELVSSLLLIPLSASVLAPSLLTGLVFSALYYGMYRTRRYAPAWCSGRSR